MSARDLRSGRAGFTLIETVLGLFFLCSMMLMAGLATDRVLAMLRQKSAEEEVSCSANRVVQRLAYELSFARRSALTPDPVAPLGTDALGYRRCQGAEDAAAVWGPPCTLRREYEQGELDDDLDNNGNGLVDEGQIVWVENEGQPDERRVVWEHGVREFLAGEDFDGDDDNGNGLTDEGGLSFSIQGDVLTIRLTLQGLGPEQNLITKTVETSVFVRN